MAQVIFLDSLGYQFPSYDQMIENKRNWENSPYLKSFNKKDIRFFQSDKGLTKAVEKYNERFRFVFDFGSYASQLVPPIRAEEDKITVVFRSGHVRDENYVPFTRWMLAHRMYHAIQHASIKLSKKKRSKQVRQSLSLVHHDYDYWLHVYQLDVNKAFAKLWNAVFPSVQVEALSYFNWLSPNFSLVGYEHETSKRRFVDIFVLTLIAKITTTKAARDGRLVISTEAYPELFAQYVVTGQVNLAPITPDVIRETIARMVAWHSVATPDQSSEVYKLIIQKIADSFVFDETRLAGAIEEATASLHQAYSAMLDRCVGRRIGF